KARNRSPKRHKTRRRSSPTPKQTNLNNPTQILTTHHLNNNLGAINTTKQNKMVETDLPELPDMGNGTTHLPLHNAKQQQAQQPDKTHWKESEGLLREAQQPYATYQHDRNSMLAPTKAEEPTPPPSKRQNSQHQGDSQYRGGNTQHLLTPTTQHYNKHYSTSISNTVETKKNKQQDKCTKKDERERKKEMKGGGRQKTNKEQSRTRTNQLRKTKLRSPWKLCKGQEILSKELKGTQKQAPKCPLPPLNRTTTMTNQYTIDIYHADLTCPSCPPEYTVTPYRKYTTLLCNKDNAKRIIYSLPFAQRTHPTNPFTIVALSLTHLDLSNYHQTTIEDEISDFIYNVLKEEVEDVHIYCKAKTPHRLHHLQHYITNLPNINIQLHNPATDLSTSKEDLKIRGTWFRPEKHPLCAEDFMPTTKCGVNSIFISNNCVLLLHRSALQAKAMNSVTSQTTNKGPNNIKQWDLLSTRLNVGNTMKRRSVNCSRNEWKGSATGKKEVELAFFKIAADKGKTQGKWIKNKNKYDVLNMRGLKGLVPELREYQRLWDIGSLPRSQPTNNYHNPPTTNTAPGTMTITKYQPRHWASGNTTQPQAAKTQPIQTTTWRLCSRPSLPDCNHWRHYQPKPLHWLQDHPHGIQAPAP
ncbi:hypothetical protein BCR33DRAFT_820531, partial [Rhizoclosmatium globosum]